MAALWNALSDVLKQTQGGVAFRVALRQHVLESQKTIRLHAKLLPVLSRMQLSIFISTLKVALQSICMSVVNRAGGF